MKLRIVSPDGKTAMELSACCPHCGAWMAAVEEIDARNDWDRDEIICPRCGTVTADWYDMRFEYIVSAIDNGIPF